MDISFTHNFTTPYLVKPFFYILTLLQSEKHRDNFTCKTIFADRIRTNKNACTEKLSVTYHFHKLAVALNVNLKN